MGYVSGFYSFIPSNTLGHRYYNNMDRRLWV
jgi:ubiquinone biosynthesis protein Coq4